MNGKISSVIRWSRGDYLKLSYAVRKFNQTISELEQLDKNVLPEEFNYTELRDSIYSRRELNRIIKALRRFSKTSQQKVVTSPSGEKITQWELSELKKSQKRALGNVTDQAREIVEDSTNVMGDAEFKKLLRTKESIEDLFNRKGSEFRRTKERTKSWGKSDYELWRASIFRENFMKALEQMSSFKNYKLLIDKLESIENPIQFYNYVRQSDILSDLFLYYKDKATAQTYGGFVDNQEAFDTGIFEQLGVNPKDEDLERRFKVMKEFELTLDSANKLSTTKDYIALYNKGKQLGIFINGDKAFDYINDNRDDLSGKIKVRLLRSKKR